MKLIQGRRVYIPSKTTFGKIIRDGGILGLKNSFAIQDDIGNKIVYVEEVPEFVYADTSKNVSGDDFTIPNDVVPLFQENLSCDQYTKMTCDYYKLSMEEREKVCEEWMNCDFSNGNHPDVLTQEKPTPETPETKTTEPEPKKKVSVKYV